MYRARSGSRHAYTQQNSRNVKDSESIVLKKETYLPASTQTERYMALETIGEFKTSSSAARKSMLSSLEEDEEEEERFPSSLLISPELLPSSSSSRIADSLVEEILIAVRRGSVTVNSIRDSFSEGSFSMDAAEQGKSASIIMDHMISSAQYGPSIRNVFGGILRSLSKSAPSEGQSFGESYIAELPDERALRTLVQLHGKGGNFARPLELLKLMPRSPWRKDQEKRFSNAANLLNSGLRINTVKSHQIIPEGKNVIYHASQSMPHTSSGYAIRTHGLTSSLNSKGYDVDVYQ